MYSYFAVGGMKTTANTPYHTAQVLSFAYCVLRLLDDFNKDHVDDGIQLKFRMGIHCGACVGSVIGTKQLSYDLWVSESLTLPVKLLMSSFRDSINVASRMESTGEGIS